MQAIKIEGNTFTAAPHQPQQAKALAGKGKFLGAFIALPEKMLKEIHFSKNQFSDPGEKAVMVKTD
jgi:hypothetical protein